MEIIIDYREANLIQQLKAKNVTFKIENLDIGDIHFIKDGEISLIIERKTIEDYMASITTKRLKNQIARIQKFKATNPQLIVMIMLEGPLQSTFGQIVNVPDHIYNSILNRVFDDNITVIRSDNINDTAIWITKLMSKLSAGISHSQSQSNNYIDTLSIKKRDNMDPHSCYLMQLAQIPGISTNIAKYIAKQYPSWQMLFVGYDQAKTIKQKQLLVSEIMTSTKKIGKVISNRLYQFCCPIQKTKLKISFKTI